MSLFVCWKYSEFSNLNYLANCIKQDLIDLRIPYVDLLFILNNQVVNSQSETRAHNHNSQMAFHEVCAL